MTCGCKIISRKHGAPPSGVEKSVSLQLSRSYSQARRCVNIRDTLFRRFGTRSHSALRLCVFLLAQVEDLQRDRMKFHYELHAGKKRKGKQPVFDAGFAAFLDVPSMRCANVIVTSTTHVFRGRSVVEPLMVGREDDLPGCNRPRTNGRQIEFGQTFMSKLLSWAA